MATFGRGGTLSSASSQKHVIALVVAGLVLGIFQLRVDLTTYQSTSVFMEEAVVGGAFNDSMASGVLPSHQNKSSATDSSVLLQSNVAMSPETLPLMTLPPHIQPASTNLVYFHVGKTGGITLNPILRSNCLWIAKAKFKMECLQNLLRPEPRISKATRQTVHVRLFQPQAKYVKEVTGFLMTLRNPLTRLHSAFYMAHPDNPSSGDRYRRRKQKLKGPEKIYYRQCFPILENVTNMLQAALTEPQNECYQWAVGTFQGVPAQGQPCGHCGMNYRYYHKQMAPLQKKRQWSIWIIRTEHLWEDTIRIDRLLGGTSNFSGLVGSKAAHKSELHKVDTPLSEQGRHIACCYLAAELQLYHDWIQQAVNLSPLEKDCTLKVIQEQCGVDISDTTEHTSSFSWLDWAKNSPTCQPYKIQAVAKNK